MKRVNSPSRKNAVKNARSNQRSRRLVRTIAFESLETRTLMSAFTVTSNADTGFGTLRQAILDANTSGGSNTITFNLPAGQMTILPLSPLPAVASTVSINGAHAVELSGVGAGAGAIGLELDGANSMVTGLTVDNFDAAGLLVAPGATGSLISNNFLGTDPTGSFAAPNGNGLVVEGASSTVQGNLISGNNVDGLLVMADHVSVKSNFIGTDVTGMNAVPNLFGVVAQTAASLTLGGASSDRNIISGNLREGATLDTSPNSLVQNNYFGTDLTGSLVLMNNGDNIDVLHSNSTVVSSNLLTGAGGDGVFLMNSCFVSITQNLIGTDVTGTQIHDSNFNPFGNGGNGVSISTASLHDTVSNNTISNNFGDGVFVNDFLGNPLFATISNNTIGADPTGTIALRNFGNGVKTESPTNTITGNLITANTNGVVSDGGKDTITGNFIFANFTNGVVSNGGFDSILSNSIGVDVSGNANGNGADGVFVNESNNTITNNVIANNYNAVTISSGTNNAISANSIFDNVFGIDLNNDGFTPNGSEGHDGPNNFQNFPDLGSATRYASGVAVSGTFMSTPNSSFTLEFFTSDSVDSSNFAEGKHFAGSRMVTTDMTGMATFTAFLTDLVAGQSLVTSTATDSTGNTSEFSLSTTIPDTLSFISTTTTLASSLNPAAVGQTVTFTANVTGALPFGTPTGTVQFFEGTTLLSTATVDASGNAMFSTSALALGNHSLTAVYSGDPTFTTSTSAPLTESITAIATTTSLVSSLNPSTYGASVTFTAHVAASASTMNMLTGTVTFMDGSTPLGTVPVDSNGDATFTTTSLEVASHSITATYSGDTSFAASTSATLTQTVSPEGTVTTLSSSENPSTFGDSVTFTAAVTAPFGTPTGTINFLDGANTVGSGTIDATGHATFTTNLLTIGGHTITAAYVGDTHDMMSMSAPLSQSVAAPIVGTTTTLSSDMNPAIVGALVNLTAVVSPVSAPFAPLTGTVTFMDGATVLGTVAVDSSGTATLPISTLSLGDHILTAVYSNDPAFLDSTSAPLTETINPVPVTSVDTTTTVTSSSNPSVFGSAVTLTATVAPISSSSNPLTGMVQFFDGSMFLANAFVDASGQASFTSMTLSVGNHTITAVYSGDANFNPSTSAPFTQTVNAITTTTTVSSSMNPSLVGNSVTFTATVTPPGSIFAALTGTVTFRDGSTVLGTSPVDATGHAMFTTSALSAGAHSITAMYSGATDFTASTSPALAQTVNRVGTTTNLATSLNPAPVGSNITFTATVAAAASTMNMLSGSVVFTDGSTVLATVPVNASGVAVFNTSALIVGNHAITATYSGDSAFSGSASASLNESIVAIATSTTVSSSANPTNFGSAVTFTATVTPASSTTPLAGTVTFKDGSTVLGTMTLDATGHATFTTSALSVGAHTITASYNATTNFTASSSAPLAQNVNAIATTTTLVSSSPSANSGAAVTFTATVSGAVSAAALTGTVTFKDGTTVLGTSTVDSAGHATFTTSTLSVGAHTITATYNGDSHYTPSTSAPLTQSITAVVSTATVDGHVYQDTTGNGLTSDDTLLSGITVKLYKDTNHNGVLDSGDGAAIMTMTTGANGAYSFTNLPAGKYFVQETTPTGYVLTAPALGTYYTYTATAGSTAHDDFDNYKLCDCSSNVTKITYTINGCTTVTDLRGHVHQGDTVTVHFTVLTGHTVTLSLISYTAPGSTFVADDADEQEISQLATGTFGAGTHTMTVVIPKCYFQVDFVCGYAIDHFGPAGSNVFYSAQQRLFSADNGGTTPPKN